jgi:hypothetical protein
VGLKLRYNLFFDLKPEHISQAREQFWREEGNQLVEREFQRTKDQRSLADSGGILYRAAYRAVWLRPPAEICWLDSPFSFARFCSNRGSLPDWVVHNVESRVLNLKSIQAKVLKGVGNDIRASVLASMRTIQLNEVVRVGRTIEASLESRLQIMGMDTRLEKLIDNRNLEGTKKWERLYRNCGNVRIDSIGAYLNAPLFATYQFFHEVFKENKLIHLARFNKMVSGYRLGTREALAVHKPTFLKQDAQGRPHSASGPCIQYQDGWSVYAWHGVHVSEKLIMHPEQIERHEWVQELNAEVRRAIQERLGNERFVEMIGGKQIDAGRRGKLIEIDLGKYDPERVAHYVQVQDSSTERQYSLRVPPSITKADEAIAWTFGLSARDYRPGQET